MGEPFGKGKSFGEKEVFWGKSLWKKTFGGNGSLLRIRKSFGDKEVFGEKTFGGKGSLWNRTAIQNGPSPRKLGNVPAN